MPGVTVADSQATLATPRKQSMLDGYSPENSDEEDMTQEQMIASGKMARMLNHMNSQNNYGAMVERGSVYGAAVAVPQIARCVGWPGTFKIIVCRTYFTLLLNYLVQLTLIYLIFQETLVLDVLSGQMSLCSFGRSFETCEASGGPNCKGPGGMPYTKHNLMGDFGDFNTRVFIKNALAKVFPEYALKINAIDSGEFGLESEVARWACVLLFALGIAEELKNCINAVVLLYTVPTVKDSDHGDGAWISHTANSEKQRDLGKGIEDAIEFKVSGIPLGWKIFNVFLIIIPKCVIWFFLLIGGCHFLLQTAGIVDLVLNSLAMTFVLDIDELLTANLSTKATRHILDNIQPYVCPKVLAELGRIDSEDPSRSMKAYEKEHKFSWQYLQVIPYRLLYVGVSVIIGYFAYFDRWCDHTPAGGEISKHVYAPVNVFFRPWNALFGTMEYESTTMWAMPGR